MRTLDALLRPLASLPPGLPLVAAAPGDTAAALAALGFVLLDTDTAPAESAAWGVAVVPVEAAPAVAARLRSRLAPGAWLSLVVEGAATPADLIDRLDGGGYAMAHLPEPTDDGDGVARCHLILRRIDAGTVG